MDKDFIKNQIGEKVYEALCVEAKRYAPTTGNTLTLQEGSDFESEVPHDISWDIWDSSLSQFEKLKLVLQIYEDMPCYAYLMYIKHEYKDFTAEVHKYLIDKFINYLSQEDNGVLSQPVQYVLWCDFFEDPETVEGMWTKLTSDLTNERVIQRILISSGPVPYNLKANLYQRLIIDDRWHYYIFRSLLHSQFDVYGDIKKNEAKMLLSKLSIPSNTEFLSKLQDELNKE